MPRCDNTDGWYLGVAMKGHDCQAVRALLVARAQIVSQITTEEPCPRHLEDVRPCSVEEVALDVHRLPTRNNRRRFDAGAHPCADAANAGSMIAGSICSRATARPHVI